MREPPPVSQKTANEHNGPAPSQLVLAQDCAPEKMSKVEQENEDNVRMGQGFHLSVLLLEIQLKFRAKYIFVTITRVIAESRLYEGHTIFTARE
jgi:hypothetical protein